MAVLLVKVSSPAKPEKAIDFTSESLYERVIVPEELLIVATTLTPSERTTETSARSEPMIPRIPVVVSRLMPAVRTIRPSSDSQWSRDSIGRD